MKATATQWPITVTIELADDYLEGLDPGFFTEENFIEGNQLEDLVDKLAKTYIWLKGQAMAISESKRKQNK